MSRQPSDLNDLISTRGAGGEIHQQAGERLTTAQGVVVADDENSLRMGPTLLEDFALREKIFHFDHERIPERVVHARGYGAHGVFTCTRQMSDVTRAAPFAAQGKVTPVFVRFSTVAGSKGSGDLARDIRGFAVKFYSDQGNWDLVGNNAPVFFIQDAIKFPDLIHAVKPTPDRDFPQAASAHDNFWDFISLTPEALHTVLWAMSDRALPRSFATMEGFGVHTFRFVTAKGQSTFVKFHWKPRLGLQSLVWDEAVKSNGADPDRHRRDLWEAIARGEPAEWDLGVQLFDQAFADAFAFAFDVLDATKLIPEEDCPVQLIGTLSLNRNVDNFFAETEQVAFCTANVIPGIDFTDDQLLQGQNFSYLDTQISRLGSPNFTQIPVNAPQGCPVSHYQQDGHMQMAPRKGPVNYQPNGWDEGPRPHPLEGYVSYRAPATVEKARLRPESFADHYSQPRQFYISQTEVEQGHIAAALVFELSKCAEVGVRARIVSHLRNIDAALAERVAKALGLDLPAPAPAAAPTRKLAPSPALSILRNPPDSFRGRVLGVMAGDGFDGQLLADLRKAVAAEGGRVTLIGPRIGGVWCSQHDLHPVDERIGGAPSVLFDAVALIPGTDSLTLNPDASSFVTDAFRHCKYIGWAVSAKLLIEELGLNRPAKGDPALCALTDGASAVDFVRAARALRHWPREAQFS